MLNNDKRINGRILFKRTFGFNRWFYNSIVNRVFNFIQEGNMAKYLIIFLLIPFIWCGTWSHRVVKTKADGSVIVAFTRSPTGDVRDVTFSRIIGDGSEQLARKKWNLEAKWSQLNNFDMGNDGGQAKEILWLLVKAIRNNPNLTLAQATGWYDTNYPDGLYNGIQLLRKFRQWIENEFGVEPDWDQFKTYVINTKFAEVDSYVP